MSGRIARWEPELPAQRIASPVTGLMEHDITARLEGRLRALPTLTKLAAQGVTDVHEYITEKAAGDVELEMLMRRYIEYPALIGSGDAIARYMDRA